MHNEYDLFTATNICKNVVFVNLADISHIYCHMCNVFKKNSVVLNFILILYLYINLYGMDFPDYDCVITSSFEV